MVVALPLVLAIIDCLQIYRVGVALDEAALNGGNLFRRIRSGEDQGNPYDVTVAELRRVLAVILPRSKFDCPDPARTDCAEIELRERTAAGGDERSVVVRVSYVTHLLILPDDYRRIERSVARPLEENVVTQKRAVVVERGGAIFESQEDD